MSGAYDTWSLVLLNTAASSRGAVCLDGSPPGYYIEHGSAKHWSLHLQGGGWCTSIEACAERASTPLGSSTTYAADKDEVLGSYDGGAHGLFSSDPAVNPDFHNSTKVYVRYCDGGSFSGDAVHAVPDGNGGLLHFRGRRVLDAVLDSLTAEQGLAPGATLLANGCSAGGLAVWLHLDYIAQRLQGVKVLGIPECGLFMDLPTYEGVPLWTPQYRAVATMQNATALGGNLNAGCLAAHGGAEAWRCFMAQYTLPHVRTPWFAVNSVYDAWQGVNILGLNANCVTHDPKACSAAEARAFEALRLAMLANLSAGYGATDGYYTYNCATHCGQFNHDERWNDLEDGELSLRERFTRWALRGEAHQTIAPKGWGPAESVSCEPGEEGGGVGGFVEASWREPPPSWVA